MFFPTWEIYKEYHIFVGNFRESIDVRTPEKTTVFTATP